MPIDNGMNAHERGPIVVRMVEMRQVSAMRVCTPCPDEDCLYRRVRREIECKGVAEGDYRVPRRGGTVCICERRIRVRFLFLAWTGIGGNVRQVEVVES